MRLLLTAWLALVVGCSGGKPTDGAGHTGTSTTSTGCATDADCAYATQGEVCLRPGEPNCPVDFSCLYSSGFCPTDQYCSAADPDFPICGDSECRPHCADDSGCRAGAETCDVGTGTCAPIPCDAGYTCPSHETCTPGSPAHGCVRDPCTADADCAGGYCVQGGCYDDPGLCTYRAEN